MLLACLVTVTHADEPEILTWQACVKEALAQQPDLISAQLAVKRADEGLNVSKAARLPTVGVSANAGESGDSDGSNDSYSDGVSARELLFDGGKTRHAIGAARDAQTISVAQLDDASASVRESLRDAFVDLLQAQQSVGVATQIAERRRQSLELVRLRYEAGREHHGSLLTAEANLASAEMDVRSANRDVEVERAGLTKALGRADLSVIQAQGELTLPVLPTNTPDFSALAETHPTMRQLLARRSSAEHDLARAKAEGYPVGQLSAQTGSRGEEWPPDQNSWSIGVGVSLSLYEGGARMASVRSDKAALESARQDVIAGHINVETALVTAWTALESAVEGVAVQEKFLGAAQERAGISEAQYSSGLITFDNWIIIEDELVRAMTSLLDARAAALKAEARWVHARGGTLDDE